MTSGSTDRDQIEIRYIQDESTKILAKDRQEGKTRDGMAVGTESRKEQKKNGHQRAARYKKPSNFTPNNR